MTESPNSGSAGGKKAPEPSDPNALGTPRTRNLRHRVEVRVRRATLRQHRAQARGFGPKTGPKGSRDRSLAGKDRIRERRVRRMHEKAAWRAMKEARRG